MDCGEELTDLMQRYEQVLLTDMQHQQDILRLQHELGNCMDNHEILQQQYIQCADKCDALQAQQQAFVQWVERHIAMLTANATDDLPSDTLIILHERRNTMQIVLDYTRQHWSEKLSLHE